MMDDDDNDDGDFARMEVYPMYFGSRVYTLQYDI